jgi:hypothetical protein
LLLLDKFYNNNQIDYDDFIDFASVFIEGSYRIHIFTLFFPWLDEGNGDGFRQFALDNQVFSKPKIKSLILDILNNLEQETRSLLLYQIKLGVEDYYYMRYTNREFELQRFLHRTNYEEIVIQTICTLCNSYVPKTVSISNFLEHHMGLMDESQKFDCPKCKQNNNKQKSCKIVAAMY